MYKKDGDRVSEEELIARALILLMIRLIYLPSNSGYYPPSPWASELIIYNVHQFISP